MSPPAQESPQDFPGSSAALHVVGNATEDLFFALPHLPRPGETLVADRVLTTPGGKGLNQAVLAARCGVRVHLLAPVGEDPFAERVRDLARAEGIRADCPVTAPLSDRSIIAVDRHGENTILSSAGAADGLLPAVAEKALSRCRPGDRVLLQGNLSRATTMTALVTARRRGCRTIANPSPLRWAWEGLWPEVDTVVLNRLELESLSGTANLEAGVDELLAQGCRRVLVTLGADGAQLFNREESTLRQSAAPVAEVVDTAGAGDTFTGVFVAAEMKGHPTTEALRHAATAAAYTINRPGTLTAFPPAALLP